MEKTQGRSVITSVGGLNDRQLLARSIGPANGGLASGKGVMPPISLPTLPTEGANV
jgi:hypothetical protein